jgi:nitroreductase
MSEAVLGFAPTIARYDVLMDIVRVRATSRQFRPDISVPRAHVDMVLEAVRHAPSGANAQPWHYVVVTDPAVKRKIADYFVAEQRRRAKLKMTARDEAVEGGGACTAAAVTTPEW